MTRSAAAHHAVIRNDDDIDLTGKSPRGNAVNQGANQRIDPGDGAVDLRSPGPYCAPRIIHVAEVGRDERRTSARRHGQPVEHGARARLVGHPSRRTGETTWEAGH